MWYVLEYKKTPKSRKWVFHSMSGDKALMEELMRECQELGLVTQLTEKPV